MRLVSIFAVLILAASAHAELRITTFQADVTPPLGTPLCGGGVKAAESVDDPLSARGVILLPEGQQPIVLCAVDWVGIANSGWDAWRYALAEAAGTEVARVAVQTLHQHDAPFCDFDTEALLAEHGLAGVTSDVDFSREAIARTAAAVTAAVPQAQPVSHIGHGAAKVDRVASNRRVMGPDGKVEHIRWSATKDPAAREREEGIIDPLARAVSFWQGETPLAVLTYYTTHPQSYYGLGRVSSDFVGMARAQREAAMPGVPHIHFNGASGNVTAGKYNDGSPENRPILAGRLADGLRMAWEATEKLPVDAHPLVWKTLRVSMPVRAEIDLEEEMKVLADTSVDKMRRVRSAREIVWHRRAGKGPETHLSALHIGPVHLLHMPGELFVEYQLAAQQMKPEAFVAMAAYGDYGAGYICMHDSYGQGGYEDALYVSRTAPEVEPVLMEAMKQLLE